MIFYSWTALRDGDHAALRDGYSRSAASTVAMGITDDRGRAIEVGEEILESGQAVAVIIEAVRPAMAQRTLAPCYARTGVGWMGKRNGTGEVTWNRFFVMGEPADLSGASRLPGRPPGRMGS
jgi:hypothetical protein